MNFGTSFYTVLYYSKILPPIYMNSVCVTPGITIYDVHLGCGPGVWLQFPSGQRGEERGEQSQVTHTHTLLPIPGSQSPAPPPPTIQ